MNTAIILAGGTGTRMHIPIPKQFIMVNKKPIISYCLDVFQNHEKIDNIVIVVNSKWKAFVEKYVKKYNINKVVGYAKEGKTRQNSIYNGLKYINNNKIGTNIVIVHDAARPLVSSEIISECIKGATDFDGAMPVIPIEDTAYLSKNGNCIDKLLVRSELFSGQAPESFQFKKYYDIHNNASEQEIENTCGSSEIAYKHGMNISMVTGSKKNFKITTIEDLENFKSLLLEKVN